MFSCGGEQKEAVKGQETEAKEVVETESKDPAEESKDFKELQELDEQRVKNDLTIDLNIAKELYSNAIAFSKDYPESKNLETALVYAAKGAEDIGNYKEAVEIYHQLANDLPESNKTVVHLYNKGKVLEEKMGKIDAAKAAYKELIKRYPRNPLSKSMKTYLSKGIIDMTAEEKILYYKELNQE
jgi:TolA-binding protein